MDKHQLRKYVRQKLAEMPAADRKFASATLSKNLVNFLPTLNSKTDIVKSKLLGGFSPLKDELEWFLEFVQSELHPCVPSIADDGSMEFHKVGWPLLSKEFMGLTLDKGFPLVHPKVIIVPGLAFSKDGGRLGRGKGYYDRYLAKNDAYKIGVCCEWQLFDEVIIEDHDVPMDAVVTDQNIYIRGN